MRRRDFLAGATAASLLPARPGRADDSQGVSATEIRIGNTAAYSGPASAYGIIAKTEPRCSRW
jgi:branched-chain amino acid transport system substrate-binding protein